MNTTPLPVVLFEDGEVTDLGPIVDTRPAFELRVGALSLRERLELLGRRVEARVRPELDTLTDTVIDAPARGSSLEGEVVVLNARALASVEDLGAQLDALASGEAVRAGAHWICARIARDRIEDFFAGELDGALEVVPSIGLELLARPWTMVPRNDVLLVRDHATLARVGGPRRRIFGVRFVVGSQRGIALDATRFDVAHASAMPGAVLIAPENILVGEGARVRPGAIIDAESGPVILGAGVVVHPGAVVVGPAYLGPATVVNPGAKLRAGTSLGALCKVGGEIEESVVHDLSNKQHDGFLGHAVVGSWVNLGADTNGSDLKNNYGNVRVDLGAGEIDSGETFVGQHLADHVKTGIDTMLTTGGVVGVAANVFGGGFVPRFVPAFAWGGAEGMRSYRLDAALDTARRVFARRSVQWDERHEALLHHVHAKTSGQREALDRG